MDSTDELLNDRGKTHGDFSEHARITQELKEKVREEPGWIKLTDCQCEAIDMIFHKIGRILAGNPNHRDHWDDIAGYARLISGRLND